MRLAAAVVAALTLLAPVAAQAGGVRRAPRAVEAAPTGAAIHGRVVDPEGRAIAGVTVLAARTDRGPLHRTRSDRDGGFRFSLPAGEYVFFVLDRALSGLTPAMVARASLAVTITVERAATSA